MTDFTQPFPVDDVDLAFPARGVELTPVGDDLPPEFAHRDQWMALADRLVVGVATDLALIPREGVDPQAAWDHLRVVLTCRGRRHQEKAEGAAYLLSLWYTGVSYSYGSATIMFGEA